MANDNRIAVLLTLDKDKGGRIEAWFSEKGESIALSRRLMSVDYSGEGGFSARGGAEVGKESRSVGIVEAKAQCGRMWSAVEASIWVEGIGLARLTLEPLRVFSAKNKHLEIFFARASRNGE